MSESALTESELIAALKLRYPGLHLLTVDDNYFFFAQPGQIMPFATLMCNDVNDAESNLSREGVYRLNLGLSKAQYLALFPENQPESDFTALDNLMPHPVYAKQRWACVLNPQPETLERLWPLLDEAWQRAVKKSPARSSQKAH